MSGNDTREGDDSDTSAILERLRRALVVQGAHPRFVFDESLRSSFSDAQWHSLTTFMFNVLHRYRGVDIKDEKTRGEILFALEAWQKITDDVLFMLSAAEDLQRSDLEVAPVTRQLRPLMRLGYENTFLRLCSTVKAMKGMSLERRARLGFLDALAWARWQPIGPLRFKSDGHIDELAPELAAKLGPEEIAQQGYRSFTQGWWARRAFPSYIHGAALTDEDWEDAVRVMAQDDTSEKWPILVAYIAKGGMGSISPNSLAADWRKHRYETFDPDVPPGEQLKGHPDPENQDLGADDPEK